MRYFSIFKSKTFLLFHTLFKIRTGSLTPLVYGSFWIVFLWFFFIKFETYPCLSLSISKKSVISRMYGSLCSRTERTLPMQSKLAQALRLVQEYQKEEKLKQLKTCPKYSWKYNFFLVSQVHQLYQTGKPAFLFFPLVCTLSIWKKLQLCVINCWSSQTERQLGNLIKIFMMN